MFHVDRIAATSKRHLQKLTLIEWLVLAMIIVVLIVILVPQPQWASSGEIRAPVRVFVFDSVQSKPITQAQVTIFRAPFLNDPGSLAEYQGRFNPGETNVSEKHQSVTDANGIAVFEFDFNTGANHEHPMTHAHLSGVWVKVEAERFGGAVVPVRYESMATQEVRARGELLVPIGLIPKN